MLRPGFLQHGIAIAVPVDTTRRKPLIFNGLLRSRARAGGRAGVRFPDGRVRNQDGWGKRRRRPGRTRSDAARLGASVRGIAGFGGGGNSAVHCRARLRRLRRHAHTSRATAGTGDRFAATAVATWPAWKAGHRVCACVGPWAGTPRCDKRCGMSPCPPMPGAGERRLCAFEVLVRHRPAGDAASPHRAVRPKSWGRRPYTPAAMRRPAPTPPRGDAYASPFPPSPPNHERAD